MQRAISKIAIISLAFGVIVGITVLITGQPSSRLIRQPASEHRVGVVDDWSFHHLVFSNPGTYEQAAKDPAALAKWLTIHYDTRFILQQMKRHAEATGGFSREMRTGGEEAVSPPGMVDPEDLAIHGLWWILGESLPLRPKPRPRRIFMPQKGLWSESLLTGAVQPNAYPAKWGPSLTSSDCYNDYVAFPTGTAGTSSTASIIALYNLYSYPLCSSGLGIPATYWAFDTGGTISTSPVISGDGSQVAFVQSNGGTTSLVLLRAFFKVQGNVTHGLYTLTITSGTVTDADANKQITGQGISSGTTIVSVSGDGSTVTMSEQATNDIAGATFTITEPGTLSSPWTLTSQASAAAYQACAAPCMLTLPLSGPVNDTLSAPFYDYTNDALYVGDDSSELHKFTGVFNGNPTEATPVTLNSTAYDVSSPVYDPTSGCVFVGDSQGYLYSVSSGVAGSVCTGSSFALFGHSEILGNGSANEGILDGPLVDSTAGMVYAFITDSANISNCSAGNNCVVQFTTSTITSGSTTAAPNGEEAVGTGGTGYYLYAGDFDNVYYQMSGSAGNLWVAGNTGATAGPGKLYRIPISSSGMGSPSVAVDALTGSSVPAWPSPLTEFCNNGKSPCSTDGTITNGGTDYLFFSVNAGDMGTTCTNAVGHGCVLSLNISNPSRSPTTVTGTVSTTNSIVSPGVTLTGGYTFTSADEGAFISGAGIPPGDTIATVLPGEETAILTIAPTTNEPIAEALTITGVTLSGSLNVTNVGSNGCWATGGLVIDNSDDYNPPLQNQVYFIGLNGNTAGGPGGATSTACSSVSGNKLLGWQASQSALQ
jgi:hypothetical protein